LRLLGGSIQKMIVFHQTADVALLPRISLIAADSDGDRLLSSRSVLVGGSQNDTVAPS